YLHVKRAPEFWQAGRRYLLANQPDDRHRDAIDCLFAEMAMHTVYDDHDWDTWQRKMRNLLLENQAQQACAVGSWDPVSPTADASAADGGRLLVTSCSLLTLEVAHKWWPLNSHHMLFREEGEDASADEADE